MPFVEREYIKAKDRKKEEIKLAPKGSIKIKVIITDNIKKNSIIIVIKAGMMLPLIVLTAVVIMTQIGCDAIVVIVTQIVRGAIVVMYQIVVGIRNITHIIAVVLCNCCVMARVLVFLILD